MFINKKCKYIISDANNYDDLYFDLLSRYCDYDILIQHHVKNLYNVEEDIDYKDIYKVLLINRNERIKYYTNINNCIELFNTRFIEL